MQQGGWNPQGGAPPGQPQGGGYGAPQGQPQGGGYGAPQGGGYGAPQGGGYGAPQGAPQPMPQGMPPGYQPPAASSGGLDKGFFGSLFDFSFSSYVTTKVLKVIYVLWMLLAVGVLLGGFVQAIDQMTSRYGSILVGLLTLIIAPLAAAMTLILGRMYTELIIVIFRIAENLQEINRKT
ncbi:MAG: DUF4282 domain-containing protein, partial [Polyangiaceae bacterium]|nr:DUF4282 domain-containing protein [Polyangiaceae bacterium]